MNILNDNEPPLPGNGISQLEEKISREIPADFRAFLEAHNGGQPEKKRFGIPGCEADADVDCFLGIGRPDYDIIKWMDEMGDLEGRFIPIGFDPGANAILLDYLDGRIYYWDSGRCFECSSDEENTYWIADSFDDFVDKLQLDY